LLIEDCRSWIYAQVALTHVRGHHGQRSCAGGPLPSPRAALPGELTSRLRDWR
jgi:hypothetical protein